MKKNDQLYITIDGIPYRSIGALGNGGQAVVYEAVAESADSSRRFAIKKFHDNDDVAEFIESEKLAQIVAEYNHQAVFAAAFIDSKHQTSVSLKAPHGSRTIKEIVQEWDRNPPSNLDPQYQDTGRLLCALDIVKSTLGALSAWHSCRVLHLDISDKNVLWCESTDRGVAYFLDMSSCKPVGYQPIGGIWSTGGFAAPELSVGDSLTPAADVYSVGALLFYLCVGKEGLFNDEILELPGFGNGNVAYIDNLRLSPGCKHLLKEILILATDRVERHYETAEEMLADIQRLEETISNRGVSRHVLMNGSVECYDRQFSKIYPMGIDQALIPEIAGEMDGHTVLLGDGGSGKTTLMFEIFRRKLEAVSQDPAEPIPIYVPLAGFDPGKENWSTYIVDYILQEYCGVPGDEENRMKLRELLKQQYYHLLLDGINESVSPFQLGEQIEILTNCSGVTVYVASRHSSFDWPCMAQFGKARLRPLTKDRVDRILRERNLYCGSDRLMEALRNPMMLSLYLAVDEDGEDCQTAGEILLGYHRRLIEQYKKGYHKEEEQVFFQTVVLDLLPMIAYKLGRMHFSDLNLKTCLDELLAKVDVLHLIGVSKDNLSKSVLDVLISCGLIRTAEGGSTSRNANYQFVHQYFLEWNTAQFVVQEMQIADCDESLPSCLSECCLADKILEFLGDLLGEYREVSGGSRIECWLQDHLAGDSSDEAQMIVRNLVEVIKKNRSGKISANFSELDLTLVNFQDCTVTGSNFTEAIVPNAAFLHQGHKKMVNLMCILSERNWIVTASNREKNLFIWDMRTGQRLKAISSEATVDSVEVSENQNNLLVHHGLTSITLIDLETGEQKYMHLLSDAGWDRWHKEGDKRNITLGFYDETSVLCNIGPEGEDQIGLWNLQEETYTTVLIPGDGYKNPQEALTVAVAYLPQKQKVYCVSSNGELVTWNLMRKCPVGKSVWIPGNCVQVLAVTPDGKRIIAKSITPGEKFWLVDLVSGEMEEIHDNLSGNGVVLTQILTSKRFIAFGTDKGLMCWDICQHRMMSYHTSPVSALAMDAKRDRIVFSDIWGTIRIGSISDSRITHSFECGREEENPKPVHIHWLQQGLVKKAHEDHILVLIGDTVRKLPVERCFQSFLDGNYCIWLGVGKDEKFYVHVSNLKTGLVITSAPWTPNCAAVDENGEVIYSCRSDLRWAKYYPHEEKILICYHVGPVKLYDIPRKQWVTVGSWSQEVASVMDARMENEARKKALLDISALCKHTEIGLFLGTREGHIQFWNLEGKLEADYKAHDQVKEIRPMHDTQYWISEGYDGTRCIWNSTEKKLLNQSEGCYYAEVTEFDDMILRKEGTGDLLFISEIEIRGWKCGNWVVHAATRLLALQEADRYIRIYDLKERKLCRTIDLSFTQADTLWERAFFQKDFQLAFHDTGEWMAVGFTDGRVGIYATRDNRMQMWETTAARDVSDSIFDGTQITGELAEILKQNGATVKNTMDNSK